MVFYYVNIVEMNSLNITVHRIQSLNVQYAHMLIVSDAIDLRNILRLKQR